MQVTGQRPSSEHCSQISQIQVNSLSERVLDIKHAPGGPFRFLKRRHGLADIIERGAGVQVNCLRVNTHHPDRKSMIVPKMRRATGIVLSNRDLASLKRFSRFSNDA